MDLVIAIPALNEEASIRSIIERTLAARERIVADTAVDGVEVKVISDGSTDGTVERAREFDEIELIEFEHNRGYGAAIKEGWRRSNAELMAFLDADGTCDPLFFVQLINALHKDEADIALGCRMNPASKMPALRRLGNFIFALMLSWFSARRVRDTASGMRVVRRTSLARLMPLPDGLHFTPAMSARAILGDAVSVVEVDMPYHEREGRSKLSVVRDGLRFLRVIVGSAFLYRPGRPLFALGAVMALVGLGLMVMPTVFYLQNGRIEEWMIYRFVVGHLLGTGAALFAMAAFIAGRISMMTVAPEVEPSAGWRLAERFFTSYLFYLLPLALFTAGGALVLRSFLDLASTGATYEHWSRFVVMSLFFSLALILIMGRALYWVLDLIEVRLRYLADS